MSVRKIVLVCVLVATMALPLVGCGDGSGGSSNKPAGGGAAGGGPARPSSNTTAE
ncbi:MAG: hypothetical protein MUF48_03160 [Pirellulaceae bacterium]|jgi:hypothetical protein|nr:hypothetical protein [Pirellulaceae bacterium]